MSAHQRMSMMSAVIAAIVVIAAWTPARPARAAGSQSAPVVGIIPVRVPAAFAAAKAQLGSFTPDGDVWLVARLPARDASTLVEVDPRGGQTVKTASAGVIIDTAMTVGPDGNGWFAGARAHARHFQVGYVTAHGSVRRFDTPITTGYDASMTSVVSGPDGMVWFNGQDGNGNVWLGHVTPSGDVEAKQMPSLGAWLSGLVFTTTGQLYAAGQAAMGSTDYTFRLPLPGTPARHFAPIYLDTADSTGSVYGWSATYPNPNRLAPSGRVSSYPWMTASLSDGLPPDASDDSATATQGAVVRASDNDIWFAAGASYYSPDGDYPGGGAPAVPFNWQLDQIGPAGKVRTWQLQIAAVDDGPIGDSLAHNQDSLEPGPDGQLYAVAYPAATDDPWQLYGITLPEQPRMLPAQTRIVSARQSADHIDVVVSCRGQVGRYCAGQIKAVVHGRAVAQQTYAIAPGYRDPNTLTSAAVLKHRTLVKVTTQDPDSAQVKTTSATDGPAAARTAVGSPGQRPGRW